MKSSVTVSIVSHGHGLMVQDLVENIMKFPEVAQILVTTNILENLVLPDDVRIKILQNKQPKGFAENHNSAFQFCSNEFFCPINPDVEFNVNPFPVLLSSMKDLQVGMVAPLVNSSSGLIEDSFRRFPTIFSLLLKVFGGDDGRYEVPSHGQSFSPDWVAGMFMLFRSQVFRKLKGFDEGFYLYYEDVDIGIRLWNSGYRILVCPNIAVVHDAQRDSRRKWRYLFWHMSSMARYFAKHWGRLPRRSNASY